MKHLLPLVLSLLASAGLAADETPAEIQLWPNGAPGFESRAQEKEVVMMCEAPGGAPFPVMSNIQNPAITPFLPPATATRTSPPR